MSHRSTKLITSNAETFDIKMLISQWLEGVKERDAKKLLSVLDPHMQLKVPFKTEVILGSINALQTFKVFDHVISNFNYRSVLIDGKTAALRFDGYINGEHLEGVDFFYFNDAGVVEKIEIMARPLTAIKYLCEAINETVILEKIR